MRIFQCGNYNCVNRLEKTCVQKKRPHKGTDAFKTHSILLDLNSGIVI